jgi:cell division protein FtsZ
MGGGTGTGVAPVVADVARGLNAVTFAIAINPFSYERGRQSAAKEGLKKLRGVTNTIVLDNDKLLELAGDVPAHEGFAIMERSISNLIESMTQHISEELISPIREEVDEYLRGTVRLDSVAEAVVEPVEIIAASPQSESVELTFTANVNPELLSR